MRERVDWDYKVEAWEKAILKGAMVGPAGESPREVFEFAGYLRKLGVDGWELASTIETTEEDRVIFVFKRPGIEYDYED